MTQDVQDLTVVIIAKNEADNLTHLLPQLKWAKQVVVIEDADSTDDTELVAKKYGATHLRTKEASFAGKRNTTLAKIKTPWVLYLDADERIIPALKQEIGDLLSGDAPLPTDLGAVRFKRQNFCYSYPLAHGGWDQDYVTRLFPTKKLERWEGEIHESPTYHGQLHTLAQPLWHFTHRNTAANLAKSSEWTIKEAQLLAHSGIPKVTGWTICRKIIMEFLRRFIWQDGFKDGMAGFVESLTQAWNRGFVYIQVWELQQSPSLQQRYQDLEKKAQTS